MILLSHSPLPLLSQAACTLLAPRAARSHMRRRCLRFASREENTRLNNRLWELCKNMGGMRLRPLNGESVSFPTFQLYSERRCCSCSTVNSIFRLLSGYTSSRCTLYRRMQKSGYPIIASSVSERKKRGIGGRDDGARCGCRVRPPERRRCKVPKSRGQ